MTLQAFATPVDNTTLTGGLPPTLKVAYTHGVSSTITVDGYYASLPSVSALAPLRFTVIQKAAVGSNGSITDKTKLTIFRAESLANSSGDAVLGTLTAEGGNTAADFAVGDYWQVLWTAEAVNDIHAHITALEGITSGLGTASTHAATDFTASPIPSNTVTYGMRQQVTAARLLGNPTGSTADEQEITLGTNLSFSGSTLNAAGGGGSGTVTSVGLSLPGEFTITVSPITTSGSLTATWASETAHYVFAAPVAGGTPSFRALDGTDLPLFGTSAAGAVAASGGGTTNYLRADGNWTAPPTGGVASISIGSTITSGSANRMLFEDGSTTLADSSQMTWDGHTLYVNNGATGGTPVAPLDIWTNDSAGAVSAIRLLNPTSLAAAGPAVDFWWWSANPQWGARICSEAIGFAAADLVFKVANGSDPVEKLRLQANGNVTFQSNVTFVTALNNLGLVGTVTFYNSNSGPLFNMGYSVGYGYSVYADTGTNQLSFGPVGSNPACGFQFYLVGLPFAIKNTVNNTGVIELIGCAGQTYPLQTFKQISSTSTVRATGIIDSNFTVSTDASRTGYVVIKASDYSGTDREGIRVTSDGTQPLVGHFGVTPTAKKTYGAATATGTYGSTEQDMLQKLWDMMRDLGFNS